MGGTGYVISKKKKVYAGQRKKNSITKQETTGLLRHMKKFWLDRRKQNKEESALAVSSRARGSLWPTKTKEKKKERESCGGFAPEA